MKHIKFLMTFLIVLIMSIFLVSAVYGDNVKSKKIKVDCTGSTEGLKALENIHINLEGLEALEDIDIDMDGLDQALESLDCLEGLDVLEGLDRLEGLDGLEGLEALDGLEGLEGLGALDVLDNLDDLDIDLDINLDLENSSIHKIHKIDVKTKSGEKVEKEKK